MACDVLREQGVRVAARSYRAWKRRAAATRTRSDAAIVDRLRALKKRDAEGRRKPEVLYGRRKMTAWLARGGFPGVSKHTVDRLMGDEGMTGLVSVASCNAPGKFGGLVCSRIEPLAHWSGREPHCYLSVQLPPVRTPTAGSMGCTINVPEPRATVS